MSAQNRDCTFDVVKALMMVWVVWGHLGLYGITPPNANIYMANAKIGVNMPVFFVMSGYFAAHTFKNASFSKIFARCVGFEWPQVIFASLCGLIMLFTGNGWGNTYCLVMRYGWFLHTMLIVFLLSYFIYRVATADWARWLLFGASYLALLFVPCSLRFWWMQQTIHMLPYFVFGLLILGKYPLYKVKSVVVSCGLIFLFAVFCQGDSSNNGMNFWHVNATWRIVFSNVREFVTFIGRTIVGCVGSISIIGVIYFWLRRFRLGGVWGASYGTTSMGVYIVHTWPMMMMGALIPWFPFPSWTRWLVAIVYFLICHYAIVLIKSTHWTRFFLFGDEAWLTSVLCHVGDRVARIVTKGK